MELTGHIGRVRPRFTGDDGASVVEYTLLVALITLVAMSSVRFFQANTASKLSCASSALGEATSGC